MIDISADLAQILKQKTISTDVRIEYGDTVINDEDILGLRISHKLNGGGAWLFGATPTRTLQLELRGFDNNAVGAYSTTTTIDNDDIEIVEEYEEDEDIWEFDEDEDFELDLSEEEQDDDDVYVDDDTGDEFEPTDEYYFNEGLSQPQYPSNWTLYPLVVKIGINSETLDNMGDGDLVSELINEVEDAVSVVAFDAEPDEDEDEIEEADLEDLAEDLVTVEEEQQQEEDAIINYTYIPIGTFYVCENSDVSTNPNTNEITLMAYDLMYKNRNLGFTSSLTYPTTLANLCAELAQTFNIEFKGDIPNIEIDETAIGTTFRQTLQNLALLTGSNVAVEPEGAFEFLYPSKVDFELKKDAYSGFVLGQDRTFVSRLVVIDETNNNVYRIGDTKGKTFTLTSSAVSSYEIANQIYGLSSMPIYYQPYGLVSSPYPQLELGDIITVYDENGVPYDVLVADLELEFSGDWVASYGCSTPTDQALGQSGGFTQYIHSLKADIIATKLLVAEKADIDYLIANYATIGELNTQKGRIDTLYSKSITTDNLVANLAQISEAYITTEMVSSLSAGVLTSGTIDTSLITISDTKSGLSIGASGLNISDGNIIRLYAGRLENGDYNFFIKNANGKVLFDATGLGTEVVSTTNVASIEGSKILYTDPITHTTSTIQTFLDGFRQDYISQDGTFTYLQYVASEPALYMCLAGYDTTGYGKVRLGTDELTFIDASNDKTALFGTKYAQIGKENNLHLRLGTNELKLEEENVASIDFETYGDETNAVLESKVSVIGIYANRKTDTEPAGWVCDVANL